MINGISGVVHSFDGTTDEAEILIKMGFYIGINGVSMRSKESIEVLKRIPLNRILLETDSPYCLIRKSYAASEYSDVVKAKHNEPSFIIQNAKALANIKNISLEEVEKVCFENTLRVFSGLKNFFEQKNI